MCHVRPADDTPAGRWMCVFPRESASSLEKHITLASVTLHNQCLAYGPAIM